jgi:serine/threonine-protein kinase
VGTVFALSAKSTYDGSVGHCQPDNKCDPIGVKDRTDANNLATVVDVVMGVGGAFVVAGAVLYFTAPRASSASTVGQLQIVPAVSPHGASIGLAQAW